MAVVHDLATLSHANTTGSVSQASFSWTHNTSASPRGVLVFTFSTTSATETATSVTYGGQSLTAVSSGSAADTATEPGRCTAWFLGTPGIPTGNQTVVVNRTNNSVVMYAICITVTSSLSASTEVTGVTLGQENAALAEDSINDGSVTGQNSVRYSGVFYGGTSVTAGSNSTLLFSQGQGTPSRSIGAVRETTAGTGSRSVGFNNTSDDRAMVSLAIREILRSPAVVNLSFTGITPTTFQQIYCSPSVATLSFTGQSVTANINQDVLINAGSATFTGRALSVTQSYQIQISFVQLILPFAVDLNSYAYPTIGTLTATGLAPRLDDTRIMTVGSGSFIGYAPSAKVDLPVYPVAVSMTLIGQAVVTDNGRVVTFGSATLNSNIPVVIQDIRINVPVGTFTITGVAPAAINVNFPSYPAAATLAFTGNSTLLAYNISVTVGAIVATGYAPTGNRTEHIYLGPPVAPITFTGLSVSVQVSGNNYAYPSAGSAGLTGYAPVATWTNHQYTYPSAATFVAAGGSVLLNFAVYPGAGALTFTGRNVVVQDSGSIVRNVSVSWVQLAFPRPLEIAVGVRNVSFLGQAVLTAEGNVKTPNRKYIFITGQSVISQHLHQETINWPATTDPSATGYRIRYGTASGVYSTTFDVGLITSTVITDFLYGQIYFIRVWPRNVDTELTPYPEFVLTAGYCYYPTVYALTTTGQAVTLTSSGISVQPLSSALTFDGQIPVVSLPGNNVSTPVSVGSITFVGCNLQTPIGPWRNATVSWVQLVVPPAAAPVIVYPSVASLTFTGHISAISVFGSIVVPVGSVAITGRLVATNNLLSITINWQDIVGEDGYRIKWGTSSGIYTQQADVGVNTTSYVIGGLTYGQTYFVCVYGLVSGIEQTGSTELVLTAGYGFVSFTASLSLTGYAPTINISGPISKISPTAIVQIVSYAPVVNRNLFASPPVNFIILTNKNAFIQITDYRNVNPPTCNTNIVGYVPNVVVTNGYSVFPAVATLSLNGQAVTTFLEQYVNPASSILTLTGYFPKVDAPVEAIPVATNLSFIGYGLTIELSPNSYVYPRIRELVFTGYAPSGAEYVAPAVISLSVVGYAPILRLDKFAYTTTGIVNAIGVEPSRVETHLLAGNITALAAFTGFTGNPKTLTNVIPLGDGVLNGLRFNAIAINAETSGEQAKAQFVGSLRVDNVLSGQLNIEAIFSTDSVSINDFLNAQFTNAGTFSGTLLVVPQVYLFGILNADVYFSGKVASDLVTYDVDFTIDVASAIMAVEPPIIRFRDLTVIDDIRVAVDTGTIEMRRTG